MSARARGIGYSEEQSPTLTSGQTVEVFSILGNAIGRKSENGPNGKPYGDDGLSPTLTTTDRHAVAFAQNQRDEVRLVGGDGQTVGKAVVESGLVRRLTPTCSRTSDTFENIAVRSSSAARGTGSRPSGRLPL